MCSTHGSASAHTHRSYSHQQHVRTCQIDPVVFIKGTYNFQGAMFKIVSKTDEVFEDLSYALRTQFREHVETVVFDVASKLAHRWSCALCCYACLDIIYAPHHQFNHKCYQVFSRYNLLLFPPHPLHRHHQLDYLGVGGDTEMYQYADASHSSNSSSEWEVAGILSHGISWNAHEHTPNLAMHLPGSSQRIMLIDLYMGNMSTYAQII